MFALQILCCVLSVKSNLKDLKMSLFSVRETLFTFFFGFLLANILLKQRFTRSNTQSNFHLWHQLFCYISWLISLEPKEIDSNVKLTLPDKINYYTFAMIKMKRRAETVESEIELAQIKVRFKRGNKIYEVKKVVAEFIR